MINRFSDSFKRGKRDSEHSHSDFGYSRDDYNHNGSERQRNYSKGWDEACEDKRYEERRQEEREEQERQEQEAAERRMQEQYEYEQMLEEQQQRDIEEGDF